MNSPRTGQPAPDFAAPATGGQTIRLADLRGRNVVLYFYPKDSTPGCTTEATDFRDRADEFARLNAVVLGVSRDSIRSHENFRVKQALEFDLLSDPDETICTAYDVMREKSMFGRKVRGIERSTFVIDREGVLRHEWRGVKVPGHVDEVLDAVTQLQ